MKKTSLSDSQILWRTIEDDNGEKVAEVLCKDGKPLNFQKDGNQFEPQTESRKSLEQGFHHLNAPPKNGILVRFPGSENNQIRCINPLDLQLYHMYKGAIYHSYKDLALDEKHHDILERLLPNGLHLPKQCDRPGLYAFSIAGSVGTNEEWRGNEFEGDCPKEIVLSVNKDKRIDGFIIFHERQKKAEKIEAIPSFYVAQLGVLNRKQGLGTKLMKDVIQRLSKRTSGRPFELCLGTRCHNTPAIKIYKDKFQMEEIPGEEVGLDPRYVGFKKVFGQI